MGGDHRDCEFLLPDGRVMTTDGDIRAPVSEATFRRLLEHVLPHDAGLDDVIVRALDALESDMAEPAAAAHPEETIHPTTTGETR